MPCTTSLLSLFWTLQAIYIKFIQKRCLRTGAKNVKKPIGIEAATAYVLGAFVYMAAIIYLQVKVDCACITLLFIYVYIYRYANLCQYYIVNISSLV